MDKSLHYNSIAPWLKRRFGQRVIKLSLDGGFSCPNRDGTKGTGGCSFCLGGSGSFAGDPAESIREQMISQKELLSRKWPEALYMAYFQSYTGTYADTSRLRELWDAALDFPGVVGLAVATRPDCLPEDVLELLEEYSRRTFLWVELGLQTSREDTAEAFNRCSGNADFERAARELKARGIRFVVHLMLGLPGETREDMLRSAEYAASFGPFGIKLHMLHLMKGTSMARQYEDAPFPLLSMEEYVDIVCDIIERLPSDVTIHRLTGDAPQKSLIAPEWTRNKHAVLNAIQQEFKRRGSWQGCRAL